MMKKLILGTLLLLTACDEYSTHPCPEERAKLAADAYGQCIQRWQNLPLGHNCGRDAFKTFCQGVPFK